MNIQVSANFKKMTSNAIFAIVLFILVYVLLLLMAMGLTALCVFCGFAIIVAKPMVVTIGIGIGLASTGFFILVFLFKFLFKKYTVDRSHLVEITQNQEPKLFQFIYEIVNEVETDFPKKIYLSSDVNASVFYDSSFWSMFLPVRKNLQIGLGLVNSVSTQEFKAILAHEFGHFSQRSMKVGSYVYNVNQIIFNMLFENSTFETMIHKWANISGFFSFFVMIAVKIIQAIQLVLSKMYDFVNVKYLGLSREMEFHADEVAANVAGSKPLIESLLRLNLADYSFNSVINFYENKIVENVKSKNIYKDQKFVLNFLAKENEIPIKNDLPLVSVLDLNKYNRSKLNIKDQWASHPSTEERIVALEKLNITKESYNSEPASNLFMNNEKLGEKFTATLFSSVVYNGAVSDLETSKFISEFTDTHFKQSFPKEFNGYYDNKNPSKIDTNNIADSKNIEGFDSLFSKEKVDLIYEYIALENDKIVLDKIVGNEINVKTFDYNGQKYNTSDAGKIIEQIEKEVLNFKALIEKNDIKIYQFFLNQAREKGIENDFENKYAYYLKIDEAFDKNFELYNKLALASNFINVVTPVEQITKNFEEISKMEIDLKNAIGELLINKLLKEDITKEMKENFEKYLSENLVYFANQNYNDENLKVYFRALNDFNFIAARCYFLAKKNLLKYELVLV